MPPHRAPFAVALVLLIASGCVHLAQKQTYTTDPLAVERMQRDYFANELVLGLPEVAFTRWYTRDGSWRDDGRPSIREVRQQAPFTIYDVGLDRNLAGSVYFKEGALDHWEKWRLAQESVVSAWMKETVTPPHVDDAALHRVSGLDPQTEKAPRRSAVDRAGVCGLEAGDAVETLVPLVFDKAHGNRIDRFAPSTKSASNPEQLGLLPEGTRLVIRRWNPIEGRQVSDAKGVAYLIDAPLGLSSYEGVFCPAGRCVPLGSSGLLSSDLDLYAASSGEPATLAIVPEASRAPLWFEHKGRLAAGSVVVIRRWSACTTGEAEIEPAGAPGAQVPAHLRIPFAPLGLFRPAGATTPAVKAAG